MTERMPHTVHALGDYLVDESTRSQSPPGPPWTGRVVRRTAAGQYRLLAETGYEWTAGAVRAATGQEQAAYQQARDRLLRQRDALATELEGLNRRGGRR